MNSSSLSGETLIAINLALCGEFNTDFAIERPHNIGLILAHSEQLSSKPDSYRYAYLANDIYKLRPFASNNLRTAALILAEFASSDNAALANLAGMLKHSSDTAHVAAALEA